MTAEAQSVSPSGRAHPKRRLRNYLLQPRFQLKYTAMVVGVTVVVAGVLGYFAYQYSRGQTQLFTINKIAAELEQGGEADQGFIESQTAYAREQDRQVLLGILGGILALALALALTGIVVTHKLVGPAYRLKRQLREVARGRLRVEGGLRKGDELQDLFESFRDMVESLRASQEKEIAELEGAIEQARIAGLPPDALASLLGLRDRMRAHLER